MAFRIPRKRQPDLVRAVVTLLLLVGLSGCAAPQSPSTPSPDITVNGTSGQLVHIDSDNVSMAGYDLENKTMIVQFDTGATYAYYGVSVDVWRSFLAAQPHPWSEVGYPVLVAGNVPYKRLN